LASLIVTFSPDALDGGADAHIPLVHLTRVAHAEKGRGGMELLPLEQRRKES